MMVLPQIEQITIDNDVFYCDHHPDCVDSIKLPILAAEMLMTDKTLILLIGGHTSEQAGEVVKRGKGWKVCRVK